MTAQDRAAQDRAAQTGTRMTAQDRAAQQRAVFSSSLDHETSDANKLAMRHTWTCLFFGLCVTSSSYVGLGCSDCSVSGQDPVRYDGGVTNPSRTMYQSSKVGSPYLHFPQGRVYRFYHGLGRAPATVSVFASFCEQLEGDDIECKSRNVAPSSGNLSVIEVWDEEMIQIRNDTCENQFYVRLVAMADPDQEIAGGAGGEIP